MGGTLAYYRTQGVDVHVICLTGGEAGTVDPKFLENGQTIAELRAGELHKAAKILGLASVSVGWYRDSGMPGTADNEHPQALINQPVEVVAARLAQEIRRIRPQVVITHDPIGGYKHPDHIAVHKATVQAFHTAADPDAYPETPYAPFQPSKLYYHVFEMKWFRFFINMMRLIGRNPRKFGRNQDVDLYSLLQERNFPVHARINVRSVLPIRDEAAACHASQLSGGPPNRGFLSLLFRWMAMNDNYMRGYPETPQHLRERDLFEGV
jgi:LmbE family N-acetylglucosaminyl deacetylase